GVGVVVGNPLRFGQGRRARYRLVRAFLMMMVAAVFVAVSSQAGVKVRAEVVSGGLVTTMAVAERDCLRQQQIRQQHQEGNDTPVHNSLVGTEPLVSLPVSARATRSA